MKDLAIGGIFAGCEMRYISNISTAAKEKLGLQAQSTLTDLTANCDSDPSA